MEQKEARTSSRKLYLPGGILVAVVVIAIILIAVFSGRVGSSQPAPTGGSETQELDQAEIDTLISEVSEHFLLPADEEPVIATVTDAAALAAEQEFYENVIDGDRLLLYIQNQRAIIYSPSRDVVVNVGPIVAEGGEQVVEN